MAFRVFEKIPSSFRISCRFYSHPITSAENALVPRQSHQDSMAYEVYKPRTAPTTPLCAKTNVEVQMGKLTRHSLQPSRMPAFFQLSTDFSAIQRPGNNK